MFDLFEVMVDLAFAKGERNGLDSFRGFLSHTEFIARWGWLKVQVTLEFSVFF